jgi:hypothetical protein
MPDIPARRKRPPSPTPGTHRSYRLNGDDRDRIDYLLEIWGEDDARLTENGVIRKALETAAALERGRRAR